MLGTAIRTYMLVEDDVHRRIRLVLDGGLQDCAVAVITCFDNGLDPRD